MCRVKLNRIEDGLIPSEKVVFVGTAEGNEEELVVSSAQVDSGSLHAAYIGNREAGDVLIELPRETVSGRRRLWVKKSHLVGA